MTRLRRLAALAAVTSIVACADSPFTPTPALVAGTYRLQTLTVTDIGSTRDWRAMGATMTMTLSPDHTTSGRLFMPGADLGGADLDVSLEGTWTLAGNAVEFQLLYESFVKDVTFIASDKRLEGNHAFDLSGVSVRIVLTK